MVAVFKAIYNSLSNKEQKVFNQLAVFPASFDLIAYAQICEENGDCLNTFSKYGLVKINPVSKRYSLHNCVTNQLRNYLPEKIARETRLKHAAYYLSIFKTAQENMLKSGEKARDGLQLFFREWANIRSAFDRVRKNSVEGKQAAELFNSFMISGAELLPLFFFSKECQNHLEAAIKVSQRLDSKTSEAQHLVNLGALHISQARYKEAGQYLENANKLASDIQDPQSKCKVLNETARLYLSTNKLDETINVLLEKIKLCQENKIILDDEITLLRLGLAYERKGEFKKAVEAMKEGKAKARQIENSQCLETLLKHIGYCLGEINDLGSANEYFDASLELARGLGKKKDEMEILLRFGTVYVRSKDANQALNLLDEGLQLAKKQKDNRYIGLFLIQIGDAYILLEDKQKAMQNYMNAMDPLKKAKETGLINDINKRLSHSFKLEENDSFESVSTENVSEKVAKADTEKQRIITPKKKLTLGKAISQIQTKTDEFIERGDNEMISYYISSIDKIIKTYNLDITDSTTRESLSALMGELRQNNHHACATIFKKKFSL